MIEGLNHFTIVAENRERTLDYYCGLLGLTEGWRPDFPFAGAWLYCGARPVLHIVWRSPLPSERAGVIDHMAFSARDLKAVKARFDARGLAYDVRRVPGGGIWQLFSHDPNGAKVELDFDASEAP